MSDQEGIFPHECQHPGCSVIVQFDDTPYCYSHSPNRADVLGYSARAAGVSEIKGKVE